MSAPLDNKNVALYGRIIRLLQEATVKAGCTLFIPQIIKQKKGSTFNKVFLGSGLITLKKPDDGTVLLRGLWLASQNRLVIDSVHFPDKRPIVHDLSTLSA